MHSLGNVLSALLLSVGALCQDSSRLCDVGSTTIPCAPQVSFYLDQTQNKNPAFGSASFLAMGDTRTDRATEAVSPFVSTQGRPEKPHFHWGRALLESFELLAIEQAYVVHDDWRWVAGTNSENGIPFNHYWRDYKQSLSAWVHSGWSDGDPNLYGYLGHPVQGVASSYIFIQNDPKSEGVEFSKTKQYWHSRLKATLWNAAYSTQWNIGPLSEPTIEKYGTKQRPPWNQDGSWPCTTKHCYTGMGQIDLVMTPVEGLGWLVGEDILDRYVARQVERSTRNRFVIDATRCGLDPIRVGTNILHGKRPWYRPRDSQHIFLAGHFDAGASH
jgi:hypothetical protein